MYFCTDKTRHATRKNSAPGRVIQRKIVFILINSGHYPPGASWAVFSNEFSFGFLGFLALPMFFGGAFLKNLNLCQHIITTKKSCGDLATRRKVKTFNKRWTIKKTSRLLPRCSKPILRGFRDKRPKRNCTRLLIQFWVKPSTQWQKRRNTTI